MTHLRQRLFGGAMLATVLVAPAAPAEDEDVSWLVVVQGEVAAVADEEMTIAADPRAIAFTDRPKRIAAIVDLANLVAVAWADDGDFRMNPPNASLIDETNGAIGVIEITDAAWADGTLALAYTILEGGPPRVGTHVALTIDGGDIAIDPF